MHSDLGDNNFFEGNPLKNHETHWTHEKHPLFFIPTNVKNAY